ncbi:MAG: peptidase domain-containing ABC transporter [Candidatus Nanopelagicales bacterium]
MADALDLDPLARQPAFALLDDDTRALLVASMEPVDFRFGEVLVREGDDLEYFYVVVEGAARVLKRGENDDEVPLRTLRPGDAFGESDLLAERPSSATLRASGRGRAMRLHHTVFVGMLESQPGVRESFEGMTRLRDLWDFFRVHDEFDALSDAGLALLAQRLEPVDVADDEVVVRQGDPVGPMYVVREGKLRASVDGVGDVDFLRSGDFFGETALFRGTPQPATVQAVTEAEVLRLPVDVFHQLLESEPGFREALAERSEQASYRTRARVPLDFADEILPVEALATAARVSAPPPVMDADVETTPPEKRGRRPGRRFPFVFQVDAADCGAACLAMVCRFFGRNVSLTHIRNLARTATDGTTLAGITRAAEDLGLTARSIRVSASRLDQLPLPAVVHWEGNHWIVLYRVERTHVRVADPAKGLRRLPREEFLSKWSGFASTIGYDPAFEDAPEERTNAAWMWPMVRPHRVMVVWAIVLAFVAAGLELLLPLLTQYVVDSLAESTELDLLRTVVPALLVTMLGIVAAGTLQRYLLAKVAVRFDVSTLDFLTGRLLNLPATYFATRRTGDIERRLGGAQQVRQFFVDSSVQVLTAGATLVAAVVLMFVYNVPLALLFLLTSSTYVWLMRFSATRLRPMYDSLEESYGKYTSAQIDAIRGIETVKALAVEDRLQQLMLARFQTLSDRIFRGQFLGLVYDSGLQLVTFATFGVFLVAGSYQVVNGNLTIGQFVAFNSLIALATGPLLIVLGLWDRFQLMRVLLNRLDDVLLSEPEQGSDRTGLRQVPSLEGHIRVSEVGFRLGGPEVPPIIDDVSFVIEPGETVAVVGRSGSGKTTLVKMLAGLLVPTEGTVEFDGIDLTTLDFRSLRRRIGVVLQETYLFDDSIAGNIAFGEPNPDPERLRWAAGTADALGFIERLPLGFDTRIGESGIALSGGQKQRISIARALYNQPPVLLFDEATSALDSESERAVTQGLDELLVGRTSVVIAHRLSTIRNADRILVLERGRLVEQGTHAELLARRGLYFHLASQQLPG